MRGERARAVDAGRSRPPRRRSPRQLPGREAERQQLAERRSSGAARRAGRGAPASPGRANSRSRWRQPPHGGQMSRPLGDDRDLGDLACRPPRQRADRRGLRALALRVGGVLDVGAGVDRPSVGVRSAAPTGSASTARGRAPSPPRRRAAAPRRRRRAGRRACAAGRRSRSPRSRRRRSRAPRAGARRARASRAQVRAGVRDALELDEVAEALDRRRGGCARPATSSRWRRLSTTASVPSAASSASRSAAGSVDRRRAGSGSRAPRRRRRGRTAISSAPPGLLLAQLQPAVRGAEVRVALAQHAAVLGAERAGALPASARGPGRAP